ncbi:MAG: ABC transporter permease [Tannerellaceae bacterium]|nr:ABC transporter permease [Tannerellaceae bacterium]MCD8263522.1 ABC transporter permease [Tannerellaceae bacterium]
MTTLKMAFRSLVRKGQNSLIKILSLSLGITMGLILLAKVFFEFSYDNFYPDTDRIYSVWTVDQEEIKEEIFSDKVSGGVAVGMRNEIPEVETATRCTYLGTGMVFYTSDLRKYKADFVFADSCFFDVLPRTVLAGNARETLARPMYVLISEKLAKTIGGGENLIGQSFYLDIAPDKRLTIGGIFETLPKNSHLHYDILISMPSLGQYFSYDGTDNWLGNDRYYAYVNYIREWNLLLLEMLSWRCRPGTRIWKHSNGPVMTLRIPWYLFAIFTASCLLRKKWLFYYLSWPLP